MENREIFIIPIITILFSTLILTEHVYAQVGYGMTNGSASTNNTYSPYLNGLISINQAYLNGYNAGKNTTTAQAYKDGYDAGKNASSVNQFSSCFNNGTICSTDPWQEFAFVLNNDNSNSILNILNIHYNYHSGVWHNIAGVFIPWST